MRLNWETRLRGESCTLVPYRKHHVETYHKWMQDSYLLEMTGSEPLTLEEEYEMQCSWRDDEEKLTFILVVDGQMVGDTNIYLTPADVDESGVRSCEIEIMIAESSFRRRGIATEA